MLKFYSTMAVSVIALQAVAGVAFASAQEKSSGLEEVVVTAQKRTENMQKVPISLMAITASQFENAGLENTWDIAEMTPGVNINRTGPTNQGFSIRGVLAGDGGAGSDQSVGIFLDDLYIGRSSQYLFDLYDIERIEILKGPQGTLSGRNSAGGAIRIVTSNPTQELSGALEGTIGKYNLIETKGRISGGLSKKVAASLSFVTSQRNGYNKLGPKVISPNSNTGTDTDAPTSATIRSKFDIKAQENLDILLTVGYSGFRQDGVSKKVYPAGTYITSPPYNFIPNPDPRLVEGSVPGFAKSKMYIASARFDWTTDIGTLTSITGFIRSRAQGGQDSIFIPAGLFRSYFANDETATDISEELRLASLPNSGRLNWVAGVYLLDEKVHRIDSYDRDLLGKTSYPIYNEDNKTTSYAAFGNFSYELIDKVKISVGGRYTKDKKHMNNQLTDGLNGTSTNGLAPALSLYNVSVSGSWGSFTPKVTIDYSPTDSTYLYATYSAGYKAGGFQGVAPERVAASTPFRPEKVNNYEIGTKTRWFDNRLQFNASAFYMNYTDMQLGIRILTIPGDEASALRLLTNASNAKIKGLELGTIAEPIPGLTLSMDYTYLHTELVHYNPGFGGVDLSGNQLPSPKHAYTISGQYKLSLGDGSFLSFYADYRYTGSRFLSLSNTPAGASPLAATEPAYGIANGRITYQTASAWKLSVWAKNIGNKLYRVNTIIVGNTGFSDFGDPSTYGVTLGKEF